jgi:predicted RNA binding protein YcfA (HicA-like mRNA interferase family)
VVREGSHVALERKNADGTATPMTIPNHATLKSSTLRTICRQAGIARDAFLNAWEES